MKNHNLKLTIIGILIAAAPAIVLTIIWLVTFGAFNLIDALHSDQTIAVSSFTTILSIVAVISLLFTDNNL